MFRAAFVFAASVALAGCGFMSSQPEPWEPDPVFTGVSYIGVSVTDIDAAEAYYVEAIEAGRVSEGELPSGNVLAALLSSGDASAETRLMRLTNAQLRLMSFSDKAQASELPKAVPVQGPGIAHVCFQVDEKTNTYSRFLEAGAAPIGNPELVQLSEQNPVHYGYVKDPQGIITEIEQVDLTKLPLDTPPKNDRRVRHVSLATPDLDAMLDFYSKLLGGQEPRHVGSWIKVSGDTVDDVSGLEGSEIEMGWFQLRNLEIEIFQYHSHPTQRPSTPRPVDALGYNMIVFDVSDIEAAMARFKEAGGTIVTQPAPMDGGEIVFGRDPDGNLIGMQKLPEGSVLSAANFPDNGI